MKVVENLDYIWYMHGVFDLVTQLATDVTAVSIQTRPYFPP